MAGIPIDLELLVNGEITVTGRLVDASNASLYADIALGDELRKIIYKPIAGERPLWDFPDGTLAEREVAAYLMSEQLGIHIVPQTILRDGPYGPGMVQLWIEQDENFDLLSFAQSRDGRLRAMVIFDAIINNTDRKFGHILLDGERLLGCDHGVTFHEEPKLRTVLWQFCGEEFEAEELELLNRAADLDLSFLEKYITPLEISALALRISELLQAGRFPMPSDEWPAVPWPPF